MLMAKKKKKKKWDAKNHAQEVNLLAWLAVCYMTITLVN